MIQLLVGVLGLGFLCGFWVVVQRFIAKHDPGQPGVEDRCGSCGIRAFKHRH
jgi:hypothetical protein